MSILKKPKTRTDHDTAVRTTSGNMVEILRQCHDDQSAIWWAKMRRRRGDRPAYLVLVTGCQKHMKDARQSPISASSTAVRRLFYCHEGQEEFRQTLKALVINPELLAIYLGMDNQWSAVNEWSTERTEANEVSDDLEVGVSRRDQQKRRGSL